MNDTKFRKILNFYTTANRLKTVIRTGWKLHEISAPRLESVAEHIYGTQMLAIAVASELGIKINLEKVIMMLAIHELGEAIIGDITLWDNMSGAEKRRREAKAVKDILTGGGLSVGDEIYELFKEFEDNTTPEAKFCKQIDKLEADLQIKIYDQQGYADYDKINKNAELEKLRQHYRATGNKTMSKAWVSHDIEQEYFDGEILELVKFLKNHELC
jgi:putative hydrolase of HD superfamily